MPEISDVLLCVLHPQLDVREELLAHCPPGPPVVMASTVEELHGLPVSSTVVVLFDPARSAPEAVRRAVGQQVELVSISDLRLPVAEVGVDALLPLRRLTTRDLSRLLFDVVQRRAMASTS